MKKNKKQITADVAIECFCNGKKGLALPGNRITCKTCHKVFPDWMVQVNHPDFIPLAEVC